MSISIINNNAYVRVVRYSWTRGHCVLINALIQEFMHCNVHIDENIIIPLRITVALRLTGNDLQRPIQTKQFLLNLSRMSNRVQATLHIYTVGLLLELCRLERLMIAWTHRWQIDAEWPCVKRCGRATKPLRTRLPPWTYIAYQEPTAAQTT